MSLRSIKGGVSQRCSLVVCLFELHAHRRAGKSTGHRFGESRTSNARDNGRVHFGVKRDNEERRHLRLLRVLFIYGRTTNSILSCKAGLLDSNQTNIIHVTL
ncbi:hypothetical protein BD408DRAFT_162496 [Parasitella parasitica]|nr:hypothetical protein BD408DRAFT_162496 [Parasitella parasitica]